MSKELFDEVVGTPPPSTVDVRGIVRRRRRVIAARRIGTVVISAVAVAAVSAITAAIAGGPATQDKVVPFGTATQSASVDLSAGNVREALALAVAARVPEGHWLPAGQVPAIEPPTPESDPPGVSCGDSAGCDSDEPVLSRPVIALLAGSGLLERPGVTGLVKLAINPGQSALACTESPPDTCAARVAPNGVLLTVRSSLRAVDGPEATRTVTVELPGDRTVVLEARAPGSGSAADTVLTEAELVDIAMSIVGRIVR